MKLKQLLFIVLIFVTTYSSAKDYTLKSPNGKIAITINTKEQLSYSIKLQEQVLLDSSPIGLVLEDQTLGQNPKVSKASFKTNVKEHIVSPHYRFSSFDVNYSELNLKLKNNYGIIFRAYDDGIAYRFYTSFKGDLKIYDEVADLNFPEDYTTYMAYSTVKGEGDSFAMAFQNLYTKDKISNAKDDNIAFLPITIDYNRGVKMTLLESDLESYPGMFIQKGDNRNSLQAVFAKYPTKLKQFTPRAMNRVVERSNYIAETDGKRDYPWRVWAITENDKQMPTNNLVYALASPSRIGDGSWIRTGKVAWEWWNNWGIYNVDFKAGINMKTYKYYIDFASKNEIEFVVLDEGWYNPKEGDMLTVIPELDLEELVQYGKQRGVDLILWTVFNVLDDQLEAACKKYSDMGISGFKVDFLDRDDQTAVEMVYRLADMTAKYKLSLDLHGIYKPTGINRTYPNIINFEGVFGMEEVKWSKVEKDMMEYDVIMPFIRMMAGPVDYTPGAMRNATKKDFKDIYYNPMSQGTRCHQLAAYIIHDSPLTMLADNPTIYMKEQECTDFIVSIPNDNIQNTLVLDGKLGEYIVMARNIGDFWYVGGMTNWDSRSVVVDFSFLPKDSRYQVTLFKDGVNVDKQAEDYKKEVFTVDSTSTEELKMAPGGGFAMSINYISLNYEE